MATDAASTLLATAARHGQFLRIDMEDSSVTDLTLDVYRVLRSRFDNVGIVLQSCLRRSRRDLQELLRDGPADIRLCKGIYLEPEQIAYRNPDEIRNSFKEILVQFIEGGGSRIGIATHDPQLVAHAEETISKLGVGRGRYEFQMLLGVAGDLRRELVERGHPLRIYVPFGQRWYEYSMRRLRENPQIAAHVLRNLFTAG
jgi:proline dehydrogenase